VFLSSVKFENEKPACGREVHCHRGGFEVGAFPSFAGTRLSSQSSKNGWRSTWPCALCARDVLDQTGNQQERFVYGSLPPTNF
jgi:hypothetical protein